MLCRDIWRKQVSNEKLKAYKQLIDDGIIRNPHVTYVLSERMAIIEYTSDHPHERVLEELSRRYQMNQSERR